MKVLVIVGSKSDLPVVEKTQKQLQDFGIESEVRIASAHRTPEKTLELVKGAEGKGQEVIIAAAGLSAHLPGVCAAHTTLPVIGLPIDTGPFNGQDALYSIVMMPPGVPVASMGIGSSGAVNAAVFAVQILAVKYPNLKEKLLQYKTDMAAKVVSDDNSLTG